MSFRQYGGINYAARNNIVKNNYTNANNLSVMTKVGQPSSIINVESGLYGIAGDITFQQLGIPKYGIMFSDGSFQNAAVTSTDSYWADFSPQTSPSTIYYTGRVIVGADPYVTGGSIESDVRLAVNGGTAMHGNLYVANGDSSNSGVIYVTDNTNITSSVATLKIAADRTNGANYIQSGKTNVPGTSADLYFTNMNASNIWMTIKNDGKVGINNTDPNYTLDVTGNLRVSSDALIHGLTVGQGGGSVSTNTAVGYQALNLNTIGYNNTAIGYQALYSYNNTDSEVPGNTAIGYTAMYSNVSGTRCTAVGYQASYYQTGQYNTSLGFKALFGTSGTSTGDNNCAFGDSALEKNTTGDNNVAVGHFSSLTNTIGSNNTAVGSNAGKNNTTTSNNTYIGYNADCSGNNLSNSTAIGYNSKITASNQIVLGTSSETVYIPGKLTVVFDASINGLTVGRGGGSFQSNTAVGIDALKSNMIGGDNNTAVGYQALNININGNFNTAVGVQSLYSNTAGTYNTAVGVQSLYSNTAPNNTAVGLQSLYSNTGGSNNTAVGMTSLYSNINGSSNTSFGYISLNNTTGNNNTGHGSEAGYTNKTGSNNTYIGYKADCTANNLSYSTAIGYSSKITASNQIVLGTSNETVYIPGKLTVVFDASINGLTVGRGGGSVLTNTAVGIDALKLNSTGYNNNTAVGYYSMRNNTASSQNTALGTNALYTQQNSGRSDGAGGWNDYLGDNTAIGVAALYWNNGSGSDPSGNLSGAWNTAVGLNALYYNTTGYYNTAIGLQAGVYFNTSEPNGGGPRTANKCTFLGAESKSSYANPIQSTAIGYNSIITANYQIMMGTSSETVYIPGTLTVIGTVTATSFNAASDYRIKENVVNLIDDSKFTVDNLRPITYKNILSGKQDMGFIAHELQEHFPFLVSGEKDGAENQSVNYTGLIALLVKEIQELKQDIKILKMK